MKIACRLVLAILRTTALEKREKNPLEVFPGRPGPNVSRQCKQGDLKHSCILCHYCGKVAITLKPVLTALQTFPAAPDWYYLPGSTCPGCRTFNNPEES